jgi:hypothetical protein
MPVKAQLDRAGKKKGCNVADDGLFLASFHSDSRARTNLARAYQVQVAACRKALSDIA